MSTVPSTTFLEIPPAEPVQMRAVLRYTRWSCAPRAATLKAKHGMTMSPLTVVQGAEHP